MVLSLKTAVTAGYLVRKSEEGEMRREEGCSPRGHQSLFSLLALGDDVSGECFQVYRVPPEVLAVGHRDVVEVILADAEDVPGIGVEKEEARVVPYSGVEDVEVDCDDLSVLDEVIIPAGLAVLERLLHLLLLPLLFLRIPHQHVDCSNTEAGLVNRSGRKEGQ